MNRSCAGHLKLKQAGLTVSSYGAGAQVKIPGKHGPMLFKFGTPYDEMHKMLEQQDAEFYLSPLDLAMLQEDKTLFDLLQGLSPNAMDNPFYGTGFTKPSGSL